ncbi:amidohydrolase [Aureimonas sp. Leaf324]|uniref:amidohydrolase n=1 Tax=Aureimonas sp. Leaf324 TaxID=1736336 RepID=UPI0006F530D5|nr:amidohydrolase [Aureimonas sp. Leaf324]KQQ91213.1 peptidase M20 [Aureimonas sp. Leaf324]
MPASDPHLTEIVALRHLLHAHPEVSNAEAWTAGVIAERLQACGPDEMFTGLGGHGVAAMWRGRAHGPTVLLRSELDALPIAEIGNSPHRSRNAGVGHLCGHDGHSAILMLLAHRLAERGPERGRVVLLFQPAEETGEGAARVIDDPRFADLTPDYALSLHNLPGLPFGEVALREGPVNCASRGMRIVLTGRTAHASMPWDGISPATALAELIEALPQLSQGRELDEAFRLATVTHARLGEAAFGIAPGHAEVWTTLRTLRDGSMEALRHEAEALAHRTASKHGLELAVTYDDVFRHCENHPEAVRMLQAALDAEGVKHSPGLPMFPSEDFGRFGDHARSAMFFLGAGVDHPRLHNPDYDFPDALIPIGAGVFERAVRDLLG